MLRSPAVVLLAAFAVGALFVAGLVVSGVTGALLLLVVAAVLAALSVQTWPTVRPQGRPVRVLVIAVVAAVAVTKLLR